MCKKKKKFLFDSFTDAWPFGSGSSYIYFLAKFFEVEILGMGLLITALSQVEKTPVLEVSLYNFAEVSHHTFGFWLSGGSADSSLGQVFSECQQFEQY